MLGELRRKFIPLERDFPAPETSEDYARMSKAYGDASIRCAKLSIALAVIATAFSIYSLVAG